MQTPCKRQTVGSNPTWGSMTTKIVRFSTAGLFWCDCDEVVRNYEEHREHMLSHYSVGDGSHTHGRVTDSGGGNEPFYIGPRINAT